MKEAIGQVFSLEFIIIFLLVVNGYLAFNVNYTKAFRVKNEIRSIIQKNEGLTKAAMDDIGDYMASVNYTQSTEFNSWCEREGLYVCKASYGSFCMDVTTSPKYGTDASGNNIGAYYTIYTFVDINIPVLNRFLPSLGGIFSVTGETSLIYTGSTAFTDGDSTSSGFSCTAPPAANTDTIATMAPPPEAG